MQKVLDGLQNWETKNNMLLNSRKTKPGYVNSIEPDLLRICDSCLERVSKFTRGMATRQPMLKLPCLTDSKKSHEQIVLFEGMQESKTTHRDPRHHDILYQNTPTFRMRPQCGAVFRLPCRRVAVYTNQVPRYHRDTKNIPSNVRGQMQSISTIKRELKRIVNDIKLPNQIFLTKPNTSHGCDLRSRPGSVAIPKSGTQRHTDSFLARAVRFLLL